MLINPNDHYQPDGSNRPARKPFNMVNQHYLSHNVVIPEGADPTSRSTFPEQRNRSPYFDPNYLIPLKPNQLNDEQRSALR